MSARAVRSEPETERELVARADGGDERAFEELYLAHRDWVMALAWRFLGQREDALDVMQETFAYLFQQFPGFELRSSMRAYLYPVVKHRSISLIRKRRKVVNLDEVRTGAELDGELEGPELRGDFARLISVLSPEQREVVKLRFEVDFKLAEIADSMGLALGTVKSRLHNALRLLLAHHGEDELR